MGKALFTYTTKIEPAKTIAEIQENLVSHGAKAVSAEFTDDGKVEALSFTILTAEKKMMALIQSELPDVAGIFQNIQPARTNVILGRRWIHLAGTKFLKMSTRVF